MSSKVRLVGIGIVVVTRCADDELEHTAHTGVHIGDGKGAVADGSDDVLYLLRVSGHHQVIACMHLCFGIAHTGPVGHHYSIESPFTTEDGGEGIVTLLHELSVDLIVRRHDGPRLRFAHHDLESAEIDLAESLNGESFIYFGSVRLLGIDGIVFGTRADTLGLDSTHHSGTDLTGEDRIFGVVFEIPSAEGIAMDIHSRTENDVTSVLARLVADSLSYLFNEGGVPSRSKGCADRKTGGIEGICHVLAHGVYVYPCRSICHDDRWDGLFGNLYSYTGRTGYESFLMTEHGTASGKAVIAATHEQLCFLLKGQRGKE